jgi:predicted acylesterase/phospholipase RssA/CRP-like cAMP-binding protein
VSTPPGGADAERERLLAIHLARLFPGLEREDLEPFSAGVRWVALRGGEVLFEQGDPGDAAYVVISGRLRAAVSEADGERILSEIGPGETVGEMALFSDDVRSATVYASRDSHLARLSREVFDALTERNPQALRRITGFVIERLRRQSSGIRSLPPLVSLAVVPARPGADLQRLVGRLATALRGFGSVELVDRGAVERALGPGIADAGDTESASLQLVRWLNERDQSARYVIYQADLEWTRWTERALRQADHILIVAMAKDGPELGANEERLAEIWRKARPPRRSLVLLHTPGVEPRNTAAWLGRRDVERHFHVRGESEGDVARLARLLTGRGVGLVLGGGGARGFAHLGVLRALEESGVPIDSVGGTSIGSIIGALPAMGLDAHASLEMCRRSFSSIYDPTFPVVSLLTGRRIGARIAAAVGDMEIEDLPIPYYCVSTNLSRAEEVVHRSGPLFRAVRSSISLPGILPPIAQGGDLYVDGGLTDNLPIDVMSEQCGGAVIAVDVSPEQDLRTELDLARGVSGWRVLARRLNPFASSLEVPYISSLLMRTVVVASLMRQRERRIAETASLYLKMPVDDWGLLDFKQLDAIAARGYEASAERIREWWASHQTPIPDVP